TRPLLLTWLPTGTILSSIPRPILIAAIPIRNMTLGSAAPKISKIASCHWLFTLGGTEKCVVTHFRVLYLFLNHMPVYHTLSSTNVADLLQRLSAKRHEQHGVVGLWQTGAPRTSALLCPRAPVKYSI